MEASCWSSSAGGRRQESPTSSSSADLRNPTTDDNRLNAVVRGLVLGHTAGRGGLVVAP